MVKAGQPAARKCFPGDALREKSANRVSIPRYSVRRVSDAAPRARHLATFQAQRGPSSYIVAALIRCPHNTQGEQNALHDDHVSERLRNRKTRLGTRLQKHGENGQVQRGTRESRRAARARRSNPARDDERARYLQRWKVESYRRPVYRSEGGGRRLLDHPGEVARRGARMGLAHPRKG